MKIAHCSSCHAEIIWALTKRRAKMPLDAEPVDPVEYSGAPTNVFALISRAGADPLALHLREISDGAELFLSRDLAGRVSHFATCPHAQQHRRPREPGTALEPRAAA